MHSSALYTITAFISVILTTTQFQHTTAFEDANFQEKLEQLQHSGVTLDEIRKWWNRVKQERKARSPRVFPLCVTTDEKTRKWPKTLDSFTRILDDIADLDEREFDPKIHTMNNGKDMGVVNFSLSAVVHNPPTSELPTAATLKQWIRVTIYFRREEAIRGLYVQSITGPLGLPGGEFRTDVVCGDAREYKKGYNTNQHTVPCSFAPRTAYIHPNVFVFDGSALQQNVKYSRVYFTYRWTEAQCQETGFFQFLIITTKDFKNYKVFLSPVFHSSRMDSETGLYTPFVYEFNDKNTQCAGDTPKSLKRFEKTKHRVIPNLEYDNCVTKGTGRVQNQNELGDTCPPGYFECKTSWRNAQEWKTQNNARKQFLEMFDNFQDCCELGNLNLIKPTTTTTTTTTKPTTTTTKPTTTTTKPTTTTTKPTTTTTKPTTTTTKPTTTTTKPTTTTATPTTRTTTTKKPETTKKPDATKKPATTTRTKTSTTPTTTLQPHQQQEKVLRERAKEAEKQEKITHGDLCILVWLVLVPLGDHIARYYKDFQDFESLGAGFWILAHVVLHSMGLILLWHSFGLVIGAGDDKLGNVSGRHLTLGVTLTIIHHAQFCTAIFRDVNHGDHAMFICVLLHSVGGYFGYIISCILVWTSQANSNRKWLCTGLFFVRVVSFIVTGYVETKQDQRIGVAGHRAQFPILQRIMLENQTPPFKKFKIFTLVFMFVIKVCMYCVIIFATQRPASNRIL